MINKDLSFGEFVEWRVKEVDGIKDFSFEEFMANIKYYHSGDCTNEAYTCDLCLLHSLLEEYEEYIFNYSSFLSSFYGDQIY